MRVRSTAAVVGAVALAVGLSGCAKDDLLGEVTSKSFDPGYTYVQMMPITTSMCSGSPPTCRSVTTGYYPQNFTVPDCFEVTVQGEKSGSTCIDQARWEEAEVGDKYVGADVDPKDREEEAPE